MRKTIMALAITLVPAVLLAQAPSAGARGQAQAGVRASAGNRGVQARANGDVETRTNVEARAHGASTANANANENASAHASDNSVFGDFSPEARTQLQATIVAARERHLPERPIRDRIAEGRARGASEAQIVASAARLRTRLEATQQAMIRAGRTQPSDGEVESGADAMERGATQVQIEGLTRHAPNGRSLTVAFQTLTRLSAKGMPVDRALAQIQAKLDARANDGEIGSLSANARGTAQGAASVGRGVGTTVNATGNAAAGVGSAARGATSVTGTAGAAVGGVIKP